MASVIYRVTPIGVNGDSPKAIDEATVDVDKIPKANPQGKLGDWVNTPKGTAYFAWAKAKTGWDVTDMFGWEVYAQGVGDAQTYWVPAKFQIAGHRNDYYINVSVQRDLLAEANQRAKEYADEQERIRILREAQGAGAPIGGVGDNPYVVVTDPALGLGLPNAKARNAKELTLPGGPRGPVWYAINRSQSAAGNGPHPNIALAGPGTWKAEWGQPTTQGLPANTYLITMDDPEDVNSVRPAATELNITMARAAQGDEAAIDALNALQIQPPDLTAMGWIREIF